jgi:hypothetical protein
MCIKRYLISILALVSCFYGTLAYGSHTCWYCSEWNNYNQIWLYAPNTLSFNNGVLSGTNFLRITLRNDYYTGYWIRAYSYNLGYFYLNGQSSTNPGKRIAYKISCNGFYTYPSNHGWAYVPGFSATQITTWTTLYDYNYYFHYTYTSTWCHLSTSDNLNQKFAGTYSDTLAIQILNG